MPHFYLGATGATSATLCGTSLEHASNCKKWLLIKKILFCQENSRPMNIRNKWTKSQPNPMIFKDFEPITFWVMAPMIPRFKVQSDVINFRHMRSTTSAPVISWLDMYVEFVWKNGGVQLTYCEVSIYYHWHLIINDHSSYLVSTFSLS